MQGEKTDVSPVASRSSSPAVGAHLNAPEIRLAIPFVSVGRARFKGCIEPTEILCAQMLIESNPDILGGKPVIKGTRIPVELILEMVQSGYSVDEIVSEYPHLSRDDLIEVLRFAKRVHEAVTYDRVKALEA